MTSDRSRSPMVEYRCLRHLNLYDAPDCQTLATQAAAGRHLRILAPPQPSDRAVNVRLCEDNYPGWLQISDVEALQEVSQPDRAKALSESDIRDRLADVIAFTHHAMQRPNCYVWGGTVAPNYDCSGLMQAAFVSAGIWIPRDAYQQEAFVEPIDLAQLQPGDLVFFGSPDKATHVGLYLGNGRYIHSSGEENGRNGIGIDELSETGGDVARFYYRQLRGAGRVARSLCDS